MVNMNNILGTVSKNAGKIGGIVGFLTASPGGFSDVQSIIDNVLAGNIHAPDLQAAFQSLANEPFVRTGIMTWIIGTVLKEIKIGGASRFGKPIADFGLNYALGAAAQKILWASTHSDEGSADHLKSMYNRVVRQPNQRAQLVVAY